MLSVSAVKKEYCRLDKILGIDTRDINVAFGSNEKTKIVAYTRYNPVDVTPTEIKFNLSLVRNMNDQDFMDVVRHEYAHAAAMILEDCTDHSEPWVRICRRIGCRPYDYAYGASIMENVSSYETEDKNLVTVVCSGCGELFRLPPEHRLVKVLRYGLATWNNDCPACGCSVFHIEGE